MKNIKRQYINIFKVTFYFIVFYLIMLVFLMVYSMLPKLIGFFNDWQNNPYFEIQRIVITTIVTALFTLLTSKLLNLNNIRAVISKVYGRLCQVYLTSRSNIICKVIESFIFIIYKGHFLPIRVQSQIEEDILHEFREISKGNMAVHIFIITGDAHSGKTILAKKLISDIVSGEEYVQLLKHYNKNIFYYDFASFQENVDEIVLNYGRNFYKNDIVIFDNIHKLNNDQVKLILATAIRSSSKSKCVLFFTRDIQHIIEGELTEEIEKGRQMHIISTPNLPKLHFEREFDANRNLENFIVDLKIDRSLAENSFVRFHLYYMYHIYLQNNNHSLKKLFKQLSDASYSKPLLSGFVFICCSVLFTGTIDKRIFKKWIQPKSMHLYLNVYIEMGALNNFCGIASGEFSMHEITARAYIEYICRNDYGRSICMNNFHFLANNTKKDELKYRYLLPFYDDYVRKLFKSIIKKGYFYTLNEDMEFVIHAFHLNANDFHYEYGVLNDRIGHYQETKVHITQYFEQTEDDKVLIQLLHADHTLFYKQNYHQKYLAMLENKNPYLRFAASYWIQHIKMHEGIWNLSNFLDIASNCGDCEEIAKHSYEGYHVLRRFYFDCFRIFYLQGDDSLNNFFNMCKSLSKIRTILVCELTEYEYYEKKFVYGHFIQYELLFRYHALNDTYIEKRALEFVGCKDHAELQEKAVNYYYRAYEYFKNNGDKTQFYVYLRLCELAPEYVINNILEKSDYEISLIDFSQEHYKAIIGEYDYFRDQCGIKEKIYEYAAFAETYKMKFNIVCKIFCNNIEAKFDKLINNNAEAAINYHQKYNPEHPNQYGILRINLLKTLNNFISSKNKQKLKKELDNYKKSCQAQHFERELRLIRVIETENYDLSPKRLGKIIYYYPIVLQ